MGINNIFEKNMPKCELQVLVSDTLHANCS